MVAFWGLVMIRKRMCIGVMGNLVRLNLLERIRKNPFAEILTF
jgi:hypothetical protein